jgi:hypothetical protein
MDESARFLSRAYSKLARFPIEERRFAEPKDAGPRRCTDVVQNPSREGRQANNTQQMTAPTTVMLMPHASS